MRKSSFGVFLLALFATLTLGGCSSSSSTSDTSSTGSTSATGGGGGAGGGGGGGGGATTYTVALYHFDSGSELSDSGSYASGSNNPLSGAGYATDVGMISEGLALAGSSTLQASDSAALNSISGSFTIELWTKVTTALGSNGAYYVLAAQTGTASPDLGWELRLKRVNTTNSRILFVGSADGATSTIIQSPNILTSTFTGGFVHIAIIFDLGTVTVYVNGTGSGSGVIGTAGSATLFNTAQPLRIGVDASGSNGLQGVIDEMRISNTVRYTGAFTPTTTPFTAD